MIGLKFILKDGAAHSVDSSELAFKLAAKGAMRQGVYHVTHTGQTGQLVNQLFPSSHCQVSTHCVGANHDC